MQLIYPKQGKEANMVLIEGIKSGKPDIKILSPFYVYDLNGQYTQEMKEILHV